MVNTIELTPVKRFFNLLKVEKQEILSIYIYALFNGVVALSLPLGIQAIINLLGGGQTSSSWIVLVVFVILGVAFTGVLQIMQLTISENLQRKIFTRSAFEFAYRIPRLKLETIDKQYTPELVNRFFDTLSVQKGLSKILMDFSSASLQVLFGLILLSFYHPFFIIFSLSLVLIVYIIFRFTAPRGIMTSLTESKYKYEVAHWLEELARAMETFKLSGNSPLPMEKTDEAVEGYLNSRKAHFKTLLTQYINLVGFKVIIAAGLLLIGGLLVINEQMNIGQFVAAEIIIILVLASIEKLILSMETIYDVLTAIEKIGYVTDIPLDNAEGIKVDVENLDGFNVKISNLNFRFGDSNEDILRSVSMEVASGEKAVVTGTNGSGKSLLLQMIAGLYDDFRGSISINDIPIGNWKKEQLHSLIGDSLMREDIFKGTLMENITLGKKHLTFEHVKNASEVVGLTEFVRTLPKGYNTPMIPEGKNLPKSVRLKIMLTRCLCSNNRLILLEDNFNQLNLLDRDRFLKHLLEKNWTVIAVSNDPSVIEQFDKAFTIDKGVITHIQTRDNEEK